MKFLLDQSIHNELERVLKTYSEEELMKAFVVIEPDGHRFRRLWLRKPRDRRTFQRTS